MSRSPLYDGSYHEVDSTERIQEAAIFAFKDRHAQGQTVVLEPIMAVEVKRREKWRRHRYLSSRRAG